MIEPSADSAPPALAAGARLGRYQLTARLGAGAMGQVWAADDPELGRKVAIKVLKDGLATWSERLRREARAMAQLDHPGVVAVYDVGEDEDRVYIAMELIAGSSLREWVATPRPWRAIVEAFVAAGRGLAAAHAAGLIHRDFKPDNVLIAADGRVAVGDFGIARLSDGTGADGADRGGAALPARADEAVTVPSGGACDSHAGDDRIRLIATLTAAGDLIGTPAYMAPEQHLGRAAGPSSDQFAFCVSLWEALFGRRPFLADTTDGLEPAVAVGLAIIDGRLTAPPAGVRVPGWLRRAIVRGLDGDPVRRHLSISALVATLEHGLARRRRVILGAAGTTALATVAAIAVSLTGHSPAASACTGAHRRLGGVWDPATRVAVRAAFTATARPYAAATADRVERILDEYAAGWTSAHIETCKATVRREQSESLLDLRMMCLDRRLAALGALTRLYAAAPDPAVLDRAVSAATWLPGNAECADVAALTAYPLPADPAARAEITAVRGHLDEIEVMAKAGKPRDALAAATEVQARARATGHAAMIAEALLVLAQQQREQGEPAVAEASLRAAYLAAAEARDDRRAARAALDLYLLVGEKQRRFADARQLRPIAEAAVARAGGDDELRGILLYAVGGVLAYEGDLAGARAAREQALALRERLNGPSSFPVAITLNGLATILQEQGDYDGARAHLDRAVAILEQVLGPAHPYVGYAASNLGNLALLQGRLDEAQRRYEQAVATIEPALGARSIQVAALLQNLGLVEVKRGDLSGARAHLERALAVREELLGRDHPDVAQTLVNLGALASEEARHDEAVGHLERALAIREQRLDPDHFEVASAQQMLGEALLARGQPAEAAVRLERALAIHERALPPGHEKIGRTLTVLAETRLALGHRAAARALVERGNQILSGPGVAPAEHAQALFLLARVLGPHERDRALTLARAARAAYAASEAAHVTPLAQVDAWLARRSAVP